MIRATIFLVAFAAPLVAQSPFEGSVTLKMVGGRGEVRNIAYLIQGGKTRIELPGGQGAMIMDPGSKTMLMIMTAQKMYMEMEMKPPVGLAKKKAAASGGTVLRTGKMETIAGYRCEHIETTDDDGAVVDAYLSTELGGFRMPMASGPMSPPKEPGWASDLGPNGFPLKAQKGDKVFFEVTAIERKSLAPALFEAPSGFKKFAMPAMPKGPPQR